MGMFKGKTWQRIGHVMGGGLAMDILKGPKQGGGPNLGNPVPSFDMRKTEDFVKNEAAPQIGGPNPDAAMQRRFQSQRDRVTGQANSAYDQNRDALMRRMASQGSVGSGAQIKIEQQMNDQFERQKADAVSQVDEQEQAALENKDETRAAQQADLDFRNKVFSFERGSKMHELDLAERQQKISSAQDQYNAKLNEFLNKPPKQGLISNLLGGIL